MWMIRAGRDTVYAEDFIQEKVVAIGWLPEEALPFDISKKTLTQRFRTAIPGKSDGQVRNGVGQIIRFLQEIKVGDQVVTYDRDKRLYFLGRIISDPQFRPTLLEEMPHVRDVEWEQRIARDNLSVEARNTLGAIQTLFKIKSAVAKEMDKIGVPLDAPETIDLSASLPNEESVQLEEQIRKELVEKAEEAIEDRIVRLDWEEMEQLVAGLLRAMGYRTTVSRRGPDRGYDVFASPDGLGLEEPRIFVEVKHRPNSVMGSQQIRSFLGGRSQGDRCLYVSTGGYSKDARYEADRAAVPLQLLGLTDLRKLLVDYYEALDEATRALIPLKRIYVLAD